MKINNPVYIEDISKPHKWHNVKTYLDQYDDPLWKKYGNDAEGAGHGGLDFFVIHAFIESVKRKLETPLEIYDAAAWSTITPFSKQSIKMGNQSMEFPDFTGGKWITRKPVFALGDDY